MIVQDSHSDAPLLPIANIERLHMIRPDRVDWVFDQTQIEAENRRKEQSRINTFVFTERMFAVFGAIFIGVCGLGSSVYLGMNGHDWLGGTIGVSTIGTLAVAFLTRGKKETKPEQPAR